MQKDPLEKYETEPSALPRQASRSLAKLPRAPRRWIKALIALLVIAAMAAGLWFAVK